MMTCNLKHPCRLNKYDTVSRMSTPQFWRDLEPVIGGGVFFLFAIFLVFLTSIGLAEISIAASGSSNVANDEWPPEVDRWVPSLGVFGGFQQQDAEGTVAPSMLEPSAPQCVPDPGGVFCSVDQQIQPFADDDNEIRRFRAGLSAELMSPSLLNQFGHPRLFVHLDPMVSAGFEQRIAGSGDPGAMIEAKKPPAVTRSDERNFSGQGTKLSADVAPFSMNVGIGVAFNFEAFDRRIRVKPSVEYLGERLTVTGEVNRVVQVAERPLINTPSHFRFITLRAVDTQIYHAVGVGLEIEIDGDRVGPFVLSPFIAGRAYRFIGNLDVSLRASNEFGESSAWEFERDAWQWAARFGVRLRFVPD